jgi:hypothetical protein
MTKMADSEPKVAATEERVRPPGSLRLAATIPRLVRRFLFLLPVLVAVLAAAQPALANTRSAADPRRDFKGSGWPGRGWTWSQQQGCWVSARMPECGEGDYFENLGGLLDITGIRHGHRAGLLTHRVSFVRNVARATLTQRDGQITFYFSTDRDAAFERRLDIVAQGRGYRGVMRNSAGRSVGTTSVVRPSGRSFEARFSRALLGTRGAYRWFAFAGADCRRRYDVCGDRAPRALLAHR